MLHGIHITLLGGDARTQAMGRRLLSYGAQITTYALEQIEGAERVDDLPLACREARVVILPTPSFVRERQLYCPQMEHMSVDVEQILSNLEKGAVVWGGRISPAISSLFSQKGVRLSDYMALEELQLRNAVPTAEGAICLAMQALDITLDRARVAVLGFGRIGSILARRLQALDAKVTVAVRRRRDLVRLETEHLHALPIAISQGLSTLQQLSQGYDVIFNTVPYRLLTADILGLIPKQTVLIELASAPGGWDPDEAKGHRAIYAPGLPAKYAPRTAGELIADSLLPYLMEVMKP